MNSNFFLEKICSTSNFASIKSSRSIPALVLQEYSKRYVSGSVQIITDLIPGGPEKYSKGSYGDLEHWNKLVRKCNGI
jgi:hypothetical protein